MSGLPAHCGYTARLACATFRSTPATLGPVLENTSEVAGNLPDSEVFSRLNTLVFGRDGLVREAGRMATSMFSTSRPPVALEKATSGFESQVGAKTMTNVVTLARPRVAVPVQLLAHPLDPIQQQAAIENALSMALYFIRQPASSTTLQAATGRASRALTLLKKSCSEAQIGGAA